jgi:pentatricopeptide repeat protein
LSVDEAVALMKRLPRGEPLPERLLRALRHLDSRAAALLLKDLSKAGLDERAIELFDWLRALPERHVLRALCDVYTYTAMISLCIYQQNVDRAMELLAEMRARGVERNVHTYTALMNVCIKVGCGVARPRTAAGRTAGGGGDGGFRGEGPRRRAWRQAGRDSHTIGWHKGAPWRLAASSRAAGRGDTPQRVLTLVARGPPLRPLLPWCSAARWRRRWTSSTTCEPSAARPTW